MDYRYFANLLDEADIPPQGITSRALYTDEHIKMVLFGFDTGQELSEHTASMPAILHILKGEGVLTLGAETQTVRPGAAAYMLASLPHSLTATTPLVMLLILLKSAKKA